jgi:hypothetical protein
VPRARWLIGRKGITYNDRGRGFCLLHDKSAAERQSVETEGNGFELSVPREIGFTSCYSAPWPPAGGVQS